jgi:hypothetical protein
MKEKQEIVKGPLHNQNQQALKPRRPRNLTKGHQVHSLIFGFVKKCGSTRDRFPFGAVSANAAGTRRQPSIQPSGLRSGDLKRCAA